LFALVSVKVLLGQSAIRATEIEGRIQAKQQRLEQLQLDVARGSSPGEIARRATELGMVRPDAIVPIRPAPPGAAAAPGRGSR
jgi:cell division protein FtsL